jgi:hypothetical protein
MVRSCAARRGVVIAATLAMLVLVISILTVGDADAQTINGPPPPNGTVGQAYNYTIIATG